MANLYPLRSTDPNALPEIESEDLVIRNMKAIHELAQTEKTPVFWAAWGGDITIRPYLGIALKLMAEMVNEINGTWVHYGELTKYGHPRHPSRLSYSWAFSEFDISTYVQNIA